MSNERAVIRLLRSSDQSNVNKNGYMCSAVSHIISIQNNWIYRNCLLGWRDDECAVL